MIFLDKASVMVDIHPCAAGLCWLLTSSTQTGRSKTILFVTQVDNFLDFNKKTENCLTFSMSPYKMNFVQVASSVSFLGFLEEAFQA